MKAIVNLPNPVKDNRQSRTGPQTKSAVQFFPRATHFFRQIGQGLVKGTDGQFRAVMTLRRQGLEICDDRFGRDLPGRLDAPALDQMRHRVGAGVGVEAAVRSNRKPSECGLFPCLEKIPPCRRSLRSACRSRPASPLFHAAPVREPSPEIAANDPARNQKVWSSYLSPVSSCNKDYEPQRSFNVTRKLINRGQYLTGHFVTVNRFAGKRKPAPFPRPKFLG